MKATFTTSLSTILLLPLVMLPPLGLLLWTSAIAIPSAAGPPSSSSMVRPQSPALLSEADGEVSLPSPKLYAIVEYQSGIRRLYTTGELVFHPKDPTRHLKVERIDTGGLQYREGRKRQLRRVHPGQRLPFPGVTFAGSALVERLQYRFKTVERITDPDPLLLSVMDSIALLEKQVLRAGGVTVASPPSSASPAHPPQVPAAAAVAGRQLDQELFAKVDVEQTDENTYEVGAASIRPVLENVNQVFTDLVQGVTPVFSSATGLGLKVKSAVAEGILSGAGFTVTSLKIAQTFGIMVGDQILSINGHPVNSLLNAWWTYQELFIRNPHLSELQVELAREGVRLVKTYRIR